MTRAAGALSLSLLAGFLWLGLPAAANEDPGGSAVDDVIIRLETQPVVVDEAMGNGETAAVEDYLTDLVDDIDVPVFVALIGTPLEFQGAGNPAEQIAAVLQSELGDGLYIVGTPRRGPHAYGWGEAADMAATLEAPIRELLDERLSNDASAAYGAALLLSVAQNPGEALSDDQMTALQDQSWAVGPASENDRQDALGTRIVISGSVTLTLLIAGLILVWIAAKRPMPPRSAQRTLAVPVPDDIAQLASGELEKASASVWSLSDHGTSSARQAAVSIDAARRAEEAGDPLDLVGTVVLARQAMRQVERIDDPDRDPYRPCFVHPLHGEATTTSEVPHPGWTVPVCATCARRPQQYLGGSASARSRPYVEGSTIWARTGFGSLVDDLAEQYLDDVARRR